MADSSHERASRPLAPRCRSDRAGHDHGLHALARAGARDRPAGLREPLGMVDDRSRGLLGLDLGAVRRRRLDTVRAHPRLADDAGRGMVPRRAPQLRGAGSSHAERRCGCGQACVGAAAAGGADAEGAPGRGGSARRGPARARSGAGDRVVAYLPNIPEAVAAFSRAPRSERSGRAARPTSGAGA